MYNNIKIKKNVQKKTKLVFIKKIQILYIVQILYNCYIKYLYSKKKYAFFQYSRFAMAIANYL